MVAQYTGDSRPLCERRIDKDHFLRIAGLRLVAQSASRAFAGSATRGLVCGMESRGILPMPGPDTCTSRRRYQCCLSQGKAAHIHYVYGGVGEPGERGWVPYDPACGS
jgi:hypothetical protein